MQLDEAFKTAREQYTKSLSALQAAQDKFTEAQKWHSGESPAERELNTAKARIALTEAQQAFESEGPAIWATFNEKRAELRQGLEKEVRAASLVDPDAIDENAIKLLESGVMKSDDFQKMVSKYDGNATMTRMIAKFARDSAGAADNAREKAALNAISVTCADGLDSTMRAWDALSKTADYCCGQAHEGRRSNPGIITGMSARWEELTAEALENL